MLLIWYVIKCGAAELSHTKLLSSLHRARAPVSFPVSSKGRIPALQATSVYDGLLQKPTRPLELRTRNDLGLCSSASIFVRVGAKGEGGNQADREVLRITEGTITWPPPSRTQSLSVRAMRHCISRKGE